jgi:large subunit ribosomal protein L33
LVALLCSVCGAQNYLTEKNKTNTPDKLKFVKYCKWCKKRTEHKESTKLK